MCISLVSLLTLDWSETKTADFSWENGKHSPQWWGKGNPRQGKQGGEHSGHVGHHRDRSQPASHHLCLHLHNTVTPVHQRADHSSSGLLQLAILMTMGTTGERVRFTGGELDLRPCDCLEATTVHHFKWLRPRETGSLLSPLPVEFSRTPLCRWLVYKCMMTDAGKCAAFINTSTWKTAQSVGKYFSDAETWIYRPL